MGLAKFFGILMFMLKTLWNAIIPHKSTFLNKQMNFAPVSKETDRTGLKVVKGSMPTDLNGSYVRNGPNPQIPPYGRYHWFDGDGMLHEIYMNNGKTSYKNRWIQTAKLKAERKSKYNLWVSVKCATEATGALMYPAWEKIMSLLKIQRPRYNTNNTALEFHDGRFLALMEVARPAHVRLPELETVGEWDYNGKLAVDDSFTAHPKVDAVTGEMMFFGYRFSTAPYCKYHVVNAEGELVQTVPISFPKPYMMHDFAITENFSCIFQFPLTFDLSRVKKGKALLAFEVHGTSRIGVIPRHAKNEDEIEWYPVKPCYMYHTFNAWEEDNGNAVVIIGCRSAAAGLFEPTEPMPEDSTDAFPFRWTIHRDTKTVEETRLNDCSMEFPVIHPQYLGRRNKYGWAAIVDWVTDYKGKALPNGAPMPAGILKMDLATGEIIDSYRYGPGIYAGEPLFVPKPGGTEEDEGYLMGFIHDLNTNTSYFRISDAKTMSAEPLCLIELEDRVPFGFHGKWVPQEKIDQQR
eukprot:TRINITY_DN66474_c3_g1_i1.p1 TRINITY_DN66474_c3_g1~~TRINITY_DN66474_c3_g1_i1.p1  ORF type:complete len:528 (+),score=59.16 TRINITY_DN66474_c3_g1_i1:30-1586(+)